MEGHIPEECISAQILELLRCHENISDRLHYLVKFSHHAVVELKSASTLCCMYPLIIREVDCNGLAAGITVSCIVDSIIYVKV